MHQTFCCILRDICEGFLYSLEGIKQWDWSQVSATCPKSHFDCTDTSTCPWGLKPLFWIFLVVFITLTKSSVISSGQMSLNLSSTPIPYLPPYLYPILFQLLPFAFPIIMYHYTLIIFISDPIKDLKYTIPPTYISSFSPIIYALIPAIIFIPHYNTWSYTVLQNSPPPPQPLPIPCPCLPPTPPFYLFITYFFCMHLNPIICICRYIIYSIE